MKPTVKKINGVWWCIGQFGHYKIERLGSTALEAIKRYFECANNLIRKM